MKGGAEGDGGRRWPARGLECGREGGGRQEPRSGIDIEPAVGRRRRAKGDRTRPGDGPR